MVREREEGRGQKANTVAWCAVRDPAVGIPAPRSNAKHHATSLRPSPRRYLTADRLANTRPPRARSRPTASAPTARPMRTPASPSKR